MKITPQEKYGGIRQILIAVARILDGVSYYVMIGCMIAMVIAVGAQVIMRYIFSYSVPWTDELARLFFIFSMFLAIPNGVRLGSHVGIDSIVRLMPEIVRGVIARLMMLLCAVLCVVVFLMGISVIRAKTNELMMTINLTANVYYFPVVFAMLHSSIHFFILAVYGPVMREKQS